MIRLRIFMQIYISVRIMKRTALRQRLVSPVKYPNKYSVLWYFIYFYVLRAFHTRLPSQKHKDAQFTDDIFHIFFYILVPIGYFIHAFRARYAFHIPHRSIKISSILIIFQPPLLLNSFSRGSASTFSNRLRTFTFTLKLASRTFVT